MEAEILCRDKVGSYPPEGTVFWIRGIALTSVAILGIIGNVLCGLTFSKMRRNTSFAVFLLCLSFTDTVILVSCIFVLGLVSMMGLPALMPVYPYFVVVFYPLMLIAQTCSAYLISTVSIERYLAVCKPFSSYRSTYSMTSRMRAYAICGAIGVGGVVLNLPRFVEYGVCTKPTGENDDAVVVYLTKSELRQNSDFKIYYRFLTIMIAVFVIPTLLLIVFNGIIYKTIQDANKLRKNLSQAQKTENSLAAMLVCVVLVYLLCNTLPIVNNILEYINVGYVTTIQVCLSDLLVVVNSSVNFIIYFASGKRFRKQFMLLWCGGQELEKSSDQEMNMTSGKNGSNGSTTSKTVMPPSPTEPQKSQENGMGRSVNRESPSHKDGIDNGGFEAL